jgi:DNA-directed RNA polymerase subunit RPC12/RpoP
MNMEYKCKKCTNTFIDELPDKFIKTVLKKCPFCGSAEVIPLTVIKKKTKK